MATTQRIACGDLSVRTGLGHSGGEIDRLAQAIDEMATSLQSQQSARQKSDEERRRLLEDVQHERSTLSGIMASMSQGLMVLDRSGHIQYCNSRAGSLMGLDPALLVGEPIEHWLRLVRDRALEPESVASAWQEAITKLRDRPSFELALLGPPQRDLLFELFPVGESHAAGDAVGILVRDVTAERDLERTKDELVSVVSHELRTPLAALVGFAEILQSRRLEETERQEFLVIMIQEGQRLTALINDLLDLQRMETGKQRVMKAPTNLRALIEHANAAVGDDPRWPTFVDLTEPLPQIWGDASKLQQVFANLLSNARKYSPEGGEVRIAARPLGRLVEVSVRDHGLGIPLEAIARVFDRFYRVDNSDRRTIKGTGLGLAICQRIVEEHGGRIWAESEGLGRGSCFRFTLPAAGETVDHGEVLVVEDDLGFARLLEAELMVRGLSAVLLGSAEAAVNWLNNSRAQAMVLDLLLPGKHGDELLAWIHTSAARDLPVVVVTVKELKATDSERLRTLGARAILQKDRTDAAHAAEAVRCLLSAETREAEDAA